MKRVLLAFALASSMLYAEPIDDATFASILQIGRTEHVPDSITYWLQVEESGNRFTGELGCATAINKLEPGGWPSVGLYQPYMRPDNIEYLLALYWYGRGETETFDPFNPIHSAKLGLRYISDLHSQLGNWYLAACAYNAGKGNVISGDVARLPKFANTRAYARRIVNARSP